MDAKVYARILDSHLLPFISEKFPNGHRFMQDNDPKHTSGRVQRFFKIMGSTGGRPLPRALTATPLKTFGMSSKSLSREKPSHIPRKSWWKASRRFGRQWISTNALGT